MLVNLFIAPKGSRISIFSVENGGDFPASSPFPSPHNETVAATVPPGNLKNPEGRRTDIRG